VNCIDLVIMYHIFIKNNKKKKKKVNPCSSSPFLKQINYISYKKVVRHLGFIYHYDYFCQFDTLKHYCFFNITTYLVLLLFVMIYIQYLNQATKL
jgi:hypothetical protein